MSKGLEENPVERKALRSKPGSVSVIQTNSSNVKYFEIWPWVIKVIHETYSCWIINVSMMFLTNLKRLSFKIIMSALARITYVKYKLFDAVAT